MNVEGISSLAGRVDMLHSLLATRPQLDSLRLIDDAPVGDGMGIQQWIAPWPLLIVAAYLMIATFGFIAVFSRDVERRAAAAWVLASLLRLVPRRYRRRNEEHHDESGDDEADR